MNALDAIEAINVEQLATATDRLLLRGGFTRLRESSKRISVASLERPTTAAETVHMRRASAWRRFTYFALITTVFSVSASIASLL